MGYTSKELLERMVVNPKRFTELDADIVRLNSFKTLFPTDEELEKLIPQDRVISQLSLAEAGIVSIVQKAREQYNKPVDFRDVIDIFVRLFGSYEEVARPAIWYAIDRGQIYLNNDFKLEPTVSLSPHQELKNS